MKQKGFCSSSPRFRFMSQIGALVLLGVMTALNLTPPVQARDLHGRLGLGYNGQWANASALEPVPGVSVKYHFTRDLGAELVGGVATAAPSNSVVGLKLFKNIFFENNLNFYFLFGAGLVSGNGRAAGQFLAGFGAEFFIPGLESLGLAFETGASLDNLSGGFILKTMGMSFLNAGIHFYF